MPPKRSRGVLAAALGEEGPSDTQNEDRNVPADLETGNAERPAKRPRRAAASRPPPVPDPDPDPDLDGPVSARTRKRQERKRTSDTTRKRQAREQGTNSAAARRRESDARGHQAARARESESAAARRATDAQRHRQSRQQERSLTLPYPDFLASFDASTHGPLHQQPFAVAQAKKYRDSVRKLNVQTCSVCREVWPTERAPPAAATSCVCQRCKTKPSTFSRANDMDPLFGDLPPRIQLIIRIIEPVEELFLAAICTVVCVHRVTGGASVRRGYAAAFRQDSIRTITRIPRLASEVDYIELVRKGADGSVKRRRVRRWLVGEFGQFLCTRNPHYMKLGVTFDAERLSLLPEDGVPDGLPFMEDEEDEAGEDLGPVPADAELGPSLEDTADVFVDAPAASNVRQVDMVRQVMEWPEPMGDGPVSEYGGENLLSLQFPSLSPLGLADPVFVGRPEGVKLQQAVAHLLRYGSVDPLYEDGRIYYPFARHPLFLLVYQDIIRRHQVIGQSTVYLSKNPGDKAMDGGELRDVVMGGGRESAELLKRMAPFQGNVTGSIQYWYQQCQNLQAAMAQKTATAFVTFTFANFHLYELHRLLPGGFSSVAADRVKSALDNPHLCDWWFSEVFKLLLKHIIVPVLGADWYWGRYEYQTRTAIHLHGVLGLKNDPGLRHLVQKVYRGRQAVAKLQEHEGEQDLGLLDDDYLAELFEHKRQGEEAMKRVVTYCDTLITSWNPDPPRPGDAANGVPDPHPCSVDPLSIGREVDEDGHYVLLIRAVQRHVCRKDGYCGDPCRFGYEKELISETRIMFEELPGVIKAKVQMKRNDGWLNEHCRLLAHLWLANTDFQIIVDIQAAAAYVAKYASKAEKASSQLGTMLSSLARSFSTSDPAAPNLKRVFLRSTEQRDIGKPEASRLVSSGSLVVTDLTFARVNVSLESVGFRRLADGNVERQTSLVEFFAQRNNPELAARYPGFPLNQPSLFSFAKVFKVVKNDLRLNNDVDKVVPVLFPNIYDSATDAQKHEEFCRNSVLKYMPWTAADIPAIHSSGSAVVNRWEEFVRSGSPAALLAFRSSLALQDSIKKARERGEHNMPEGFDQEAEREGWMEIAEMGPAFEEDEDLMGDGLVMDASHDWMASRSQYTPQQLEQATGFLEAAKGSNVGKALAQRPVPRVTPDQLNTSQRLAFDIVERFREQGEQLLLIISGTAGTGKTHTINAISTAAPPLAVVRAAFTAKAALLINGRTLHSLLKLARRPAKFKKLSNTALKDLQDLFEHVDTLIIDEYSMVSAEILGMVDMRLREIFAAPDLVLGGRNVLLVGDCAQLPPVGASPVYALPGTKASLCARMGHEAYRHFCIVVNLSKVERQRIQDGDEDQRKFVEILQGARNGIIERDGWQHLMRRTPDKIPNFDADFADAIRLFSENKAVDAYNSQKLGSLRSPIAVFRAANSSKEAKREGSDLFGGLENQLKIAVGAKIALTFNLWTEAGLTNGTPGTVRDIVYASAPDVEAQPLPHFVVVEVPDYAGPAFFEDDARACWIPISPFTLRSEDKPSLTRTQLPLRLGFAATIHKSQGQSLAKAVIDIGPRELAAGLTFVALSRLVTFLGLAFVPCNYDRVHKIRTSAPLKARQQEEARLQSLAVASVEEALARTIVATGGHVADAGIAPDEDTVLSRLLEESVQSTCATLVPLVDYVCADLRARLPGAPAVAVDSREELVDWYLELRETAIETEEQFLLLQRVVTKMVIPELVATGELTLTGSNLLI